MNILKCSEEAMSACPDKELCERQGEARFAEGSECHKFNEKIAAGASPRPTIRKEKKPMNNLKETVDMMLSQDYKERFKAEVCQLDIRIGKLANMLSAWQAGELGFQPTCSYDLLEAQLNSMKVYRHFLAVRAEIEGVAL